MRLITLLCLSVLIVFTSVLQTGCAPPAHKSAAEPNTGHPRLILGSDFLTQIREDCRGRSAEVFGRLKTSVDSVLAISNTDSLDLRFQARLAQKCGFLFAVTRDIRYAEAGARMLANALERYIEIERSPGGGNWETVEYRRYCCFAWDWLYNGLSEQQRTLFGSKILEAGRAAWESNWFTPYGGGGYGTLDPVFWPAVTLHGCGIDDSTAAVWFAQTDRNIHEWRKMQSQVAVDDGGMYSGLAYASYNYLRTPIFDFECWKSITGEDLAEDNSYLKYFSVWWTYCNKPNGEWPRIDDTGSVKGSIAPWHFKYLATRYRDGISMWQAGRIKTSRTATVWDVIWNPAGLGIEPTGPDSTWPLARHFEGIGWTVLRSGWDSNATYSVFDCGDFYYGHQHPAENAFTIFRGGSLAINSGRYEWGSDHRPNYTVRTIASNSMLVYDPKEKFVANSGDTEVNNGPDGKLLSNDGGQSWPRAGRQEFGEMQGTKWDTGQIIAFETNPFYSYVCGDATASYSAHKLKKFVRQYVHLQPDIFVVFDRVESTRPEYKKYWLLHTVNEPKKDGDWLAASERDGKIYLRNLLPRKANVEKIGGEGKEFWIFGKNHPPAMTHYAQKEGEQWGSWRIQTSDTGKSETTKFLNVLYAATAGDDSPPSVKSLDSAGKRPGVEIAHKGRTYQLIFDSGEQPGGDLIVTDADGKVLLEKRLTSLVQPQQGIGN